MQPERAWFFQVTFETPEGDKEDEVVVGLKDRSLDVYGHVRPKLKVFKEKNREQTTRQKTAKLKLIPKYLTRLSQ